jgi:hypothetical protein
MLKSFDKVCNTINTAEHLIKDIKFVVEAINRCDEDDLFTVNMPRSWVKDQIVDGVISDAKEKLRERLVGHVRFLEEDLKKLFTEKNPYLDGDKNIKSNQDHTCQ